MRRPALKTVASLEIPNRAVTRCTMRAGGSIEPANAEPSQSRMARPAAAITGGGMSSNFEATRKSASCRVTHSGDLRGVTVSLNAPFQISHHLPESIFESSSMHATTVNKARLDQFSVHFEYIR